MDLRQVGVALPFGSWFKGNSRIVGVATVLLFALEVKFFAVVANGSSSLLSPSIPCRRNSATLREAIFISPSIDWCIFWLKSSQTKIKATDIGCFLRLHVQPDLDTCPIKIRLLLWHCTSRILVE